MSARVKICGLTRAQDVEAAIAAGADMLGFIVAARSSRRVEISDAAVLARPALGVIPRVAVTVNMRDEDIARLMQQMQPDFIQLHGDESPKRAAYIGRRFKIKTIKAIAISDTEDLPKIANFRDHADLILLDAKPPKGETQRGGHGTTFDWSLLSGTDLPETYLLAGGLTPENVRAALTATNAPILDVSSGVEQSPGLKDADKIKHFIAKAKHGTAR